jgi:histidine decarboxylase
MLHTQTPHRITTHPLIDTPPSSRYREYCEGYFASASPNYMLGISVKAAVVDNSLTCPGSTLLDEINAFDLAEVQGANLGQLNITTVSSFCGPCGVIWGYDVCQPSNGHQVIGTASHHGHRAEVLDLDGLSDPFTRLIGSVDEKRFPFMPGSHVPAALKSKTARDPGILYAALALGIPDNRRTQACLMMENTGFLPPTSNWASDRLAILDRQAHSVLAVGENQGVRYNQIFAGIASVEIRQGQTGCAMALAPYMRLAQDAFIDGENLAQLTIDQWETGVRGNFLARHV